MSKERILPTAIMDEETVLVKAMKSKTKNATTHLLPMKARIVYGITKRESTSCCVNSPG